jgi:uncharacterized membrane protein YfcA
MMAYVLICATSLFVAALTLFSGFGLGTILMPVFALFFPVDIAIAATAVVHLANNLFKLALVGRWANRAVVVRFAVPAAMLAFIGAWLLLRLSQAEPLVTYAVASRTAEITPVKLVVAVVIAAMAVLELGERFQRVALGVRWLPAGGALSGFLGGLSGHQGALRAAFLLKTGLNRDAFIGTSVASAVIVDLARLTVYGIGFFTASFATVGERDVFGLVAAAMVCAFVGSFLGARLVKKVTLRTIRWVVGVMLLLLGAALGTGVV